MQLTALVSFPVLLVGGWCRGTVLQLLLLGQVQEAGPLLHDRAVLGAAAAVRIVMQHRGSRWRRKGGGATVRPRGRRRRRRREQVLLRLTLRQLAILQQHHELTTPSSSSSSSCSSSSR